MIKSISDNLITPKQLIDRYYTDSREGGKKGRREEKEIQSFSQQCVICKNKLKMD